MESLILSKSVSALYTMLLLFLPDIDECLTPDTCPSNSTCINTVGSYKCSCHEGFVKDTQGLCQGKQFTVMFSAVGRF